MTLQSTSHFGKWFTAPAASEMSLPRHTTSISAVTDRNTQRLLERLLTSLHICWTNFERGSGGMMIPVKRNMWEVMIGPKLNQIFDAAQSPAHFPGEICCVSSPALDYDQGMAVDDGAASPDPDFEAALPTTWPRVLQMCNDSDDEEDSSNISSLVFDDSDLDPEIDEEPLT
ncbi:hypothetical protein B0H14DRAFT_2573558 [Mycena olivaceomarginata]|nr:hypothetical protein B0H14DRAFT_2573558 [Mycena olivaceomarginata]